MLDRRAAISVGGAGIAVAIVVLFAGTYWASDESPEGGVHTESPDPAVPVTADLPRVMGGGIPPASKLSRGHYFDDEVTPFINATGAGGPRIPNPQYSQYVPLLKAAGSEYSHLQVYRHPDNTVLLLGKVPLTEDNTDLELLFSQNYITVSFAPRQGEPLNLYNNNTNPMYRLTDVSDSLGKALMMEMAQTVYPDGTLGVISPLKMLFLTESNHYSILGHLTEEHAVRMANAVISVVEGH